MEEEVELPGCWTVGWPPLQSDLPSPGPSMEFVPAGLELLPTQNCLVVVEEGHSSCFLPSCQEEEGPRTFPRVVEEEDSSSYQSSHCSRSSVGPREAELTDSSEVWLRMFADLHLCLHLCLHPSRPSYLQRRTELAAPVCHDQSSARGTQRLLELHLCLCLRLCLLLWLRLLEEVELHHPARP